MQKPNNAVASPSMCALLPLDVHRSNLTSLLHTSSLTWLGSAAHVESNLTVVSSGFYTPGRWPFNFPIASLSIMFYSFPILAALRLESPLGLPNTVCFDANVEQKLNQQNFPVRGAGCAIWKYSQRPENSPELLFSFVLQIRMDCNVWAKYTNVYVSTFTVGGRLRNASQLCTLSAHSYTKYTGSFTVGGRMYNWNYAFIRVFVAKPRALVP